MTPIVGQTAGPNGLTFFTENPMGFTDKRSNYTGSNDKGSNDKGSKVRQRVKRQKVKMDKNIFYLNHRKLATLLSILNMDLLC